MITAIIINKDRDPRYDLAWMVDRMGVYEKICRGDYEDKDYDYV